MRVLIFGAGASKPAGYPVAGKLIPAIEKFVEGEREVMLKRYWERWDSWRKNTRGILREIAFNPNPEVVLSLPDLYETALRATSDEHLGRALRNWKAGQLSQEDERRYKDYLTSHEHKELSEGWPALKGFIECLQRFFFFRHYQDAKTPRLRDYLRRHFARLSEGDVVITLSWDTTVERTLYEEGDWSPITGYGFRKNLRTMPYRGPLPRGVSRHAKVTVLKLHGSIGWHPSPSGGVYFDHPLFLSQFGFSANGNPVDLVDPEAPSDRPPEDSVLLYPSFLKQLSGFAIQQIWHAAAESLRKAERVDVYGYSLPESDTAVRTLLNVLRFRSAAGKLRLRVHDPGESAQSRWRNFLGDSATIDGQRVEEDPAN